MEIVQIHIHESKIVYIGSWKRVPLNGMVTSPFLKFL